MTAVVRFTVPGDIPNSLSASGALKLARMIEDYWTERGFPEVHVRTVPIRLGDESTAPRTIIYGLRSNLDHRGLPERYAAHHLKMRFARRHR